MPLGNLLGQVEIMEAVAVIPFFLVLPPQVVVVVEAVTPQV
jgi:hypothetical protein